MISEVGNRKQFFNAGDIMSADDVRAILGVDDVPDLDLDPSVLWPSGGSANVSIMTTTETSEVLGMSASEVRDIVGDDDMPADYEGDMTEEEVWEILNQDISEGAKDE